jgi:hypothetical protein
MAQIQYLLPLVWWDTKSQARTLVTQRAYMQQPVGYNRVLVRSTLSLPQLHEYFSPLRYGFLTMPRSMTLCFQGCRKNQQQIVLVVVLSFGGFQYQDSASTSSCSRQLL